MKLYVYVLEAKDLHAKYSYVKLKVGKHKSKTRILRNTQNPVWNEEFVFKVSDLDKELVVSVLEQRDDSASIFNGLGSSALTGHVRIPLSSVVAEDNRILPPTWFPLERVKTERFIGEDCGKILLMMSLHNKGHGTFKNFLPFSSDMITMDSKESGTLSMSSRDIPKSKPSKKLMKTILNRFNKLLHKNGESSRTGSSSELCSTTSDYEDSIEENPSTSSFEEELEKMKSKGDDQVMPNNLPGGILLDQSYLVSPHDLNNFLFSPMSHFRKSLAELQGTTNVQEGLWTWKCANDSEPCLSRVVSYTRAATKLVGSVKAVEEQTYVKVCGTEFAIFVSVSTPEVPYGTSFKVEILYKILPGPEVSSSGEDSSSRLIVSYGINFLHSTMMKGMIEGGVRQGLKESFEQFSNLMGQNLPVLNSEDLSDRDSVLASLEAEHKSDWEFAAYYFWNFTVISTVFMALYFLVHILLCGPSIAQGLEFIGLDLPDSFSELIASGILVLQLEHVYNMVSYFLQATLKRRGDHGVKAEGDGWILTVAVMEGVNISSLDQLGFPDPYVVLTCNGRTRTSSVKLQTHNPQWNEILELGAMEDPPSVLEVEIFDFDGPFNQGALLGHVEINLLKHTSTELADMWVPLEGKLAQASQTKLHLRIFMDNSNGVETIKEYLTKMEKEVGKKLNLQSPHKNSVFQKLFGLPPEEFLISDFTCSLKRKIPLQGRLFLSARTVGFYSNLFGHKTKFFFLWEDIEDVKILPPSISSIGTPTLIIVLRIGRGLDASHSAKSRDEEGRLKFYFQSFVSFNEASRMIMALWRTRTMSPDQRDQISEEHEDQEERFVMLEDAGFFLEFDEAKMSEIYSEELPININLLMEMFRGGKIEHRVMEESGCLHYTTTTWEPVKPDHVFERHLSYKFNRFVSIFGGEVTCTQQKFPLGNDQGWIINETMTLHDIPFHDHFRVHFRYVIERLGVSCDASKCKCSVKFGISWLKSTKFQERISHNIADKFAHRLKLIFELVSREIFPENKQENSI